MPKAGKGTPLPPPPGPNLDFVQSMLAKARSTVEACETKRKLDLENWDRLTKAKAAPPAPAAGCPKAPPARVRGKTPPGVSPKIGPPPPPKAKATAHTATPAEAKAKHSGISPAKSSEACSPAKSSGSEPSPAQRTQQYLQDAKEKRLAKSAPPDSLQTPPPKYSNASPKPTPSPPTAPTASAPLKPAQEQTLPDETCKDLALCLPNTASPPQSIASTPGSDTFCNSQKEYFGRKGQSWWGPDCDHASWFWDSYNNRYVVTQGEKCWFEYPAEQWTKPWWEQDQEQNNLEANLETALTDLGLDEAQDQGGDEGVDVRTSLALRKPSVMTVAHESSDGMAPDEMTDEQQGEPQAPLETPDTHEQHGETPPETPTPSPAVVGVPDLPRSCKPDKVEAWRLDKKGNPISPEALYMRFYRRLRSYLACIYLFVWWLYGGQYTTRLDTRRQAARLLSTSFNIGLNYQDFGMGVMSESLIKKSIGKCYPKSTSLIEFHHQSFTSGPKEVIPEEVMEKRVEAETSGLNAFYWNP